RNFSHPNGNAVLFAKVSEGAANRDARGIRFAAPGSSEDPADAGVHGSIRIRMIADRSDILPRLRVGQNRARRIQGNFLRLFVGNNEFNVREAGVTQTPASGSDDVDYILARSFHRLAISA